MPAAWDERIGRWVEAGVLDPGAAARIRAWEATQSSEGPRWPVRLALGLGGLLLCAGVLLFVAAHWDSLAPGSRFALLLVTIAAFHLGGAISSERSRALSATLHACGTAALGGGIFLAGQIFHLSEHWPSGLLLWALGAWVGWGLLRDWPQVLLAALLTPAWLAGEWTLATGSRAGAPILAAGLLLTALAYLAAVPVPAGARAAPRLSLAWAGGIALIPLSGLLVASEYRGLHPDEELRASLRALGWLVAVGGPAVLVWTLRRGVTVPIAGLGVWVVGGAFLGGGGAVPYAWAAVLSLGLIAWGVTERRSERINLGVAGFALTVLIFYFSSVMDRLGRSASLVGLGLLFLAGGWALEQGRRRLVARVKQAGP
jgi:hypothetical protein